MYNKKKATFMVKFMVADSKNTKVLDNVNRNNTFVAAEHVITKDVVCSQLPQMPFFCRLKKKTALADWTRLVYVTGLRESDSFVRQSNVTYEADGCIHYDKTSVELRYRWIRDDGTLTNDCYENFFNCTIEQMTFWEMQKALVDQSKERQKSIIEEIRDLREELKDYRHDMRCVSRNLKKIPEIAGDVTSV